METTITPAPSVRAARIGSTVGPLLLVTTAHPSLFEHTLDGELHPNLGRLVQPRHYSSIDKTADAGVPWAADNDCFQGLDPVKYDAMLTKLKPFAKSCLFVTVPDVVGDAVATAKQFELWAPALERRGLPVALVLQDGLEELPEWLSRTWHRLDAVFVGGSTEWKLGGYARAFARAAARDGKWVHWGRVNTQKRIDYIVSTGAVDSLDGSKWARWRKTHLDNGLASCRASAGALNAARSFTQTALVV